MKPGRLSTASIMPITTLFFDLDDTLLGNDIEKFIPPYFRSFAAHVSGVVDPQLFIKRVLAGTEAMIANTDPRRTLEQVFYDTFYPGLGVTADQLAPYIDSYYAEQFAGLQNETSPIPAAREAVQWALESGLRVVVATNALFPRSAILQRLAWAGVSADDFNYSLITTIEFMHFAKPQPEYFAEVLALTESRPEEVLMVGNDWLQDITPASEMGIHTFWIAPPNSPLPANHARPVGAGPLADFLNWARTPGNLQSLTPLPASPRGVRAHQAASLAAFVESTRRLPAEAWQQRPREGEWSPTEIACHLRDVELEVNLPRLRKVLAESNPFISAVESDPWALARDYQSQSGPAALADFADARREKIALLDGLSLDQWQRPARHAIFGPTTLQELVALTVEHDRVHLKQIKENLRLSAL
jgi:FMN phosphatase YigB (HAD superfamily)